MFNNDQDTVQEDITQDSDKKKKEMTEWSFDVESLILSGVIGPGGTSVFQVQ